MCVGVFHMQLGFRLSALKERRRFVFARPRTRSVVVLLCRFEGCDENGVGGGDNPLCLLHQSFMEDLNAASGHGE